MYGLPYAIAIGTNSDVDATEVDVVSVTDQNQLTKSQFTCYISYDLGTHSSLQIRFYYRAQIDGNWYQVPKKNEGDNTIDEGVWTIDSDSPASRLVIEFPVGAAVALKATAKGVGGADASITMAILTRDN